MESSLATFLLEEFGIGRFLVDFSKVFKSCRLFSVFRVFGDFSDL
jgi:hypothetical protein